MGDVAKGLHALEVAAERCPAADRFAMRWLREHPDDPVFLQYLGDEAMLRRDLPAAASHSLAPLQRKPGHAAGLNNLAWVERQRSRPGALALDPENLALCLTLARLYTDLGAKPGAPAGLDHREALGSRFAAQDQVVQLRKALRAPGRPGPRRPGGP